MSKEAMKLALEALEGAEALLLSMGLTHLIVYGDAEKAITAIRAALVEQPQQSAERGEPALASVVPHCYMDEYGNVRGSYEYWMECEGGWFPVYTSPQPRQWIELSDAEIHNMTILMGFNPEWVAEVEMVKSIVRNLEAKLKEKNT